MMRWLYPSFHLATIGFLVHGGGIYYNYPISSLTTNGFTVCYQATYATPTTSSDLASCYGCSGNLYFVGAISSTNPANIAVGAFGTSKIFTATYSTLSAYYDSLGAYWYDYPGKSFGFADNSSVFLTSCDNVDSGCASRLCWHLDQNAGGYRAGCTMGLNFDNTWTKIIYVYNGPPISLPTLPVISPTVAPTGTHGL